MLQHSPLCQSQMHQHMLCFFSRRSIGECVKKHMKTRISNAFSRHPQHFRPLSQWCTDARLCVCQRDHQNFCLKIHTVTLGAKDLWSPVCRRSGRSKIMKFTLGRHVCRPKWSSVLTSISLIQTKILFASNRPSVLVFETRRGIIQLSRLVFVLDRKHRTQTQRVSLRSSRIASCERG